MVHHSVRGIAPRRVSFLSIARRTHTPGTQNNVRGVARGETRASAGVTRRVKTSSILGSANNSRHASPGSGGIGLLSVSGNTPSVRTYYTYTNLHQNRGLVSVVTCASATSSPENAVEEDNGDERDMQKDKDDDSLLLTRPAWNPVVTTDGVREEIKLEVPDPAREEAKQRNSRIAKAESPEEILQLYSAAGHEYNAVNLCTTFHRLAKKLLLEDSRERAKWRQDARTLRLASDLQDCIEEFDTQALGNIAWAHSKLGHGGSGLIELVSEAATPRAAQFRGQEIASLLWAVGNQEGSKRPGWVRALLKAFASEVCQRIEDKHSHFDARNIHATVWAYASCEYLHPRLMNNIASEVVLNIQAMPMRTLANVAWAFGKLEWSAPHMFQAISQEVQARGTRTLSPIDVSHFTWSCARLAFLDPRLMNALGRVAVRKIAEFPPQALANTTWAYARLEHYHQELFEAVETFALDTLPDYNPQALANLMWLGWVKLYAWAGLLCRAFAACRHDTPELFDATADLAVERMEQFSEVGLASLANAFAIMGHEHEVFWSTLERAIESKLDTMSARTLANTAWALVVMNRIKPSLFVRMRSSANTKNEYSPAILSQLFQVDLALRYEAPLVKPEFENESGVGAYLELLWLAGNLRGTAARHWHRSKYHNERNVSDLHMDVSHTLTAMEIDHVCEYDDEEFAIDIVLPAHRIAIEVDGPIHYTVNTLRPMGATLLKRRLLSRLGWKVLSVPYFEYNTFGTFEHKVRLLETRLLPMLESARAEEKRQALSVSNVQVEVSTHEGLMGIDALALRGTNTSASASEKAAISRASDERNRNDTSADPAMLESIRNIQVLQRKLQGAVGSVGARQKGSTAERKQLLLQAAVNKSLRQQATISDDE